ncbi:H(+)-transporting V1 sector ATPase subunit E [Sporobolomyces koalae]|uniref:H(+)-transporting V1 sector ATPase subunit E n=1 Tax=Sporobolomyces koalae TaxID=500713 RepID=UPI0031756316
MPGLTDDEVVSEMRKMTAFIKQEALEKAREIKVKADEEFAIEKGKIVRQESSNIDANLERRKKQAEIERKIAISNQNNKARLQLLEKREELLEHVFDEAKSRIGETTKDKAKYGALLKDLILQALYTIMEKDIQVSGRPRDQELLKKAAESAAKEFEESVGFKVKIETDDQLGDKSNGGVLLKGYGSRIVVNNTLDERLRLLEERMLPEIRESLFGKNENRRSQPRLLGHLTVSDKRLEVYETDDPRLPSDELLLDWRSPAIAIEIEWFFKKWYLGQDVYLVSSPGPFPRRLALTFLSLVNVPFEYVSLHRDIGEGDLKQTREIRPGGTLEFVDSAVVRAAKAGKALILEGIERCERGILPTLNNLLENREMNLEDGTHIVSQAKYDQLVANGENTTNFVACHPRFRVIAIGLPVPPYPGLPIDPPFRSRFQCRYLDPVLANKVLAQQELGNLGEPERMAIEKLGEAVLTLQVQREMRAKMVSGIPAGDSELPLFPQTSLAKLARFLSLFPLSQHPAHLDPAHSASLLRMVHPGLAYISKPARRVLQACLEQCGLGSWAEGYDEFEADRLGHDGSGIFGWHLESIERSTETTARLTFTKIGAQAETVVPCGPYPFKLWPPVSTEELKVTPRFLHLLTSMMQLHSLCLDIALIPASSVMQAASSSTSHLISTFASSLGYCLDVVHLYKEIGGRELWMRREVGGSGGVTTWSASTLVQGMKEGKLIWLEAADTIGATLNSLSRLFSDRQGELWDGKRLIVQKDRRGSPIFEKIHPSFRIIATSSKTTPTTDWVTEDLASNLAALTSIPMPPSEEHDLLMMTGCPPHLVSSIEAFAFAYRTMTASPGNKSRRLGTASLVRIAQRLARFPAENLRAMLERTLLVAFLPITEREQVDAHLAEAGLTPAPLRIHPPAIVNGKSLEFISRSLEGEETRYGIPLFCPTDDPDNMSHVPHMTTYLDNQTQTVLMRDIAVDLELERQHILLLGNQGVGKNKIIDRLLQLLGRGREYVQLSRDTTTQSLLQSVALEKGVLRYLETPLIRAIRLGRVLVIDETDKASPNVVAAIASLASRGELSLPSGASVRPSELHVAFQPGDIAIHPNFRLVLLANRPGFPFLGNAFLQVLGDNFSSYAVPNPDLDSEIAVLEALAPDLSRDLILGLTQAFQALRIEFDKGNITYPFSLRELLALVRHIQQFDDPLEAALRNVFDFDVHSPATLDALYNALRQYNLGVRRVGIDAVRGAEGSSAEERVKSAEIIKFEPTGSTELDEPKHGKEDDKEHSGGNTWAGGTGGRDTAGLGGRGGYKRLFKGHTVRQISDQLKAQVPDEISDRAREMARTELAQKLAEIDMSSAQASSYSRYHDAVSAHIQSLVSFLENLRAKEEERIWLKRQSDGDLDESRITEGLTGESTVYKRRGSEKPDFGQPQLKPKRIRFVFDLSASMYRNQIDGRLARSLEALVMILEAFSRLSPSGKQKYKIELYAHSGEEASIPLVVDDPLPSDAGAIYKVLAKAALIPQYCWPGDHTLEAIDTAIDELAKLEADDYFVIALSDANFDRYSITAEDLRRSLERNQNKVTAALVAIGDGGECEWLAKSLPGKAYRVKETGDLARTLKSILGKMLD